MTTPYDKKILVVTWQGQTTPGQTIADTAVLIRKEMPNVAGIMLKTSNGLSWQGHLGNDQDAKAITGTQRISQWVQTFEKHGLEVHVWGVPRAKTRIAGGISPDIDKKAEKLAAAALVPGVRSLLLDIEYGQSYWQGTPQEAQLLMQRIRQKVGNHTHIGMILDSRRLQEFSVTVDPWIPFVDSLHPMVYPIYFGSFLSIDEHLNVAFNNLGTYNKPIVPMLQSFAEQPRRPSAAEITQQGRLAFMKGGAGISFFRLGSDEWGGDKRPHMGPEEYRGISAISVPAPVAHSEPVVYTWQDVINAVTVAAIEAGEEWDQWLSVAGFWIQFHNSLRRQPYSGPKPAMWPLAKSHRTRIEALLQLDSKTLTQLTISTQEKQRENHKKLVAAQPNGQGSIIGIHGAPGVAAPPGHTWEQWSNMLKEMGVRWYKQCDNGDPDDTGPHSIFAWVKRLKAEGIEPIIRYLVSEQFPDSLPDQFFQKMEKYAQIGVVWAEIGNEPNLASEWKRSWQAQDGHPPAMRHSNPEAVRRVAETWLGDAQKALNAGVKPAFYAFAPTDWRGGSNALYSSVFYTDKVVAYLARHHRQAAIDVFRRGGWIAVHAATYEQALDFDPFQPGQPVWDMTLRSYEVVLKAFRDHFGAELDVDAIPIMSTEGGVFTPDSTSMNGHVRLISDEEHAKRVLEMYRWLARHSPLQAMCPWCISVGNLIGHFDERFQFDGWIVEANGQLMPRPVYESMRQLRFDNAREMEAADKRLNPQKLAVPFLSQFDPTAASHGADCGPTCIAMLINTAVDPAKHVTVDQLYQQHEALKSKTAKQFTTLEEMQRVGRDEGMPLRRQDYPNAGTALPALKQWIKQGTPFIALVNYNTVWNTVVKEHDYRGGHFVVVTGYDDSHIFVHDPLFRSNNRQKGKYFVWRFDKFLSGWGSGSEIGNPNFCALIPNIQVPQVL